MELRAQEFLHNIFLLHHILDAACLCAHTRTGKGMEDGGLLLDWLADHCAHHCVDL